MPRVRITQEEGASFMPFLGAFRAGQYDDELTHQSVALAQDTDERGCFVPMVSVIVDATLATLERPSVKARLEREIDERRYTAQYVAAYAIAEAYKSDVFYNFVDRNRHFQSLPPNLVVLEAMDNQPFIMSLVTAPFADVRMVAGGVLNLLKDHGIEEKPAEVIARSSGLLAIAGVDKRRGHKVMDYLGDPYVATDHLELTETDSGLSVAFTQEAQGFLRAQYSEGSGCPAHRIHLDETVNSLLESRWRLISEFLVPDDATADYTSWSMDPEVERSVR